MSRLCFIFILLLPHLGFAICLDPVPQQYIVVTSDPERLLQHSNTLQKSAVIDWIYNHHKLSQARYKTQNYSKKNIVPLSYSTLVMNLSQEQYNEVKSKPYVQSIDQDCYVDINTVDSIKPELTAYNFSEDEDNQSAESKENENQINDNLITEQFWYLDMTGALIERLPSEYKVTVAVSDTGFFAEHKDLNSNLWENSAESQGQSRVDDDGNKCVDDIHGCDVTSSNGDISLNRFKSTYYDHGTHVAGIIGAIQNNHLGIYGLGNNVELMLVKSFSSHRSTTSSDLMKSIYYAVNNGAQIINCSWGVRAKPNMAEFLAFEHARNNDVLTVVAAGNDNIYASGTSPAGLSNVLTVGSMNSRKEISTFSNYGEAVDIYAPGGDKSRLNEFIFSTVSDGRYEGKRGTSMAAPFVTAVLANVKSAYPQATRNELMNLLFISAENKSLRAFYEPDHIEASRIINVFELYQKAKEYFNQELRYLDIEPKKIVKPTQSSGTVSSSSSEGAYSSSSGCFKRRSNNLDQASLQTEVPIVAVLLTTFPLFIAIILKWRNRRNSKV